jgi:hypothetical protein
MKRQSRINLDLHQPAVGATPTTTPASASAASLGFSSTSTLAPRSPVSSRPMRRPLEAEHVEEDVGARGDATGLEEAVRSGRQDVDVDGLGEARGVGDWVAAARRGDWGVWGGS